MVALVPLFPLNRWFLSSNGFSGFWVPVLPTVPLFMVPPFPWVPVVFSLGFGFLICF